MSKVAFAAALSVLLLGACSREDRAATANDSVDSEANALGNGSPSDPAQPDSPVNATVEPIPPPDAVSHPDGYLPPAPAEADPAQANSPADESPPATEDQYIRNRQVAR